MLFPELVNFAALSVTAMGLIVVVSSFAQNRKLSHIPMALDFWTAAGLLRLSGTFEWQIIIMTVTFISIRKITSLSLKKFKL